MDPNSQQQPPSTPPMPIQNQNISINNTPSSRGKNIILISLGVIIILFIGSIIGYWFANNNALIKDTNQTSQILPTISTVPQKGLNWETYTNTQNSFSIKYPNELLEYKEDFSSNSIRFIPIGVGPNDIPQKVIIISIQENPANLTATDYWKKEIQENRQPDMPISSYSLNNLDAIKVGSFGLDHIRLATIIVASNKKIYYFMLNEYTPPISTSEKSIEDDIFNQIVSTFKLTNDAVPNSIQFSSEGQNCGINAGAGGDAQCAPELTCKYTTNDDELKGIGTCVK